MSQNLMGDVKALLSDVASLKGRMVLLPVFEERVAAGSSGGAYGVLLDAFETLAIIEGLIVKIKPACSESQLAPLEKARVYLREQAMAMIGDKDGHQLERWIKLHRQKPRAFGEEGRVLVERRIREHRGHGPQGPHGGMGEQPGGAEPHSC